VNKKYSILGLVILLTLTSLCLAVAATADSQTIPETLGPNPLAGDGESDGNILETPNGANGVVANTPFGPAPNSGDSISDGSGLDAPLRP
jgi:hypothetical protein